MLCGLSYLQAACCGTANHALFLASEQEAILLGVGMLLVDTQMKTLRRPAALPDFLHTQEGHLSDIVDALRSDWLLKVCPQSLVGSHPCVANYVLPIMCCQSCVACQ